MVDTLTPNLKLTNQTEGGNDNTWGTIADANFEEIDDKLGDVTSISTTGGTTALTDAQEIVNAIHVSGTLVSNATIEFSGRGGTWIVKNTTAGAFTVTCKVTGQTGVTVTQGQTKTVYCNGTDIADTGSTDLVNDTTPQAGGDIDMNSFDIQFDDATGIRDDSDNEQLIFQKTSSAVNHVEVTNAAAGSAPLLAAVGDDTDVDLDLRPKGAGKLKSSTARIVSLAAATAMLFVQTAAPTGWTKSAAHNDKTLRVVSGAASSGGSTAFSTVFASRTPAGTVGGTTLTINQMPLHGHPWRHNHDTDSTTNNAVDGGFITRSNQTQDTHNAFTGTPSSTVGEQIGGTGGGASHDHTFTGTAMDFAVHYVNVIIATID